MEGRIHGRTDGQTGDGRTGVRMDGRAGGQTGGRMDGQIGGRKDRRTEGQADGRTDKVCTYSAALRGVRVTIVEVEQK